ncbi:DUF2065 domain-containing protein [Frateuria aurantia]
MWRELGLAVGLMVAIEGLLLFAVPRQWQAAMRSALSLDPRQLRWVGGGMIMVGLVVLRIIR